MARTSSANDVVVVRRAADPVHAIRAVLDEIPWPGHAKSGASACIAVGLGTAAWVSAAVVDEALSWLAEHGIDAPAVIGVVPQADRDSGWSAASLLARHGLPTGLLVDAWSRTEPAAIGPGHLLEGRPLSQPWQGADLRIVLAPAATDPIDGCALVLEVLAHVPVFIAGAQSHDVVTDLMQSMPPHLSIIDATVVSDGPAGTAVRRPLPTDTVIAATSALLADLVGARLMGLDPFSVPPLAAVTAVTGVPAEYRIDGDLTPYAGLDLPAEALLRSMRAANPGVQRVLAAAMADEHHPDDDDTVLALLRKQLRPTIEASGAADASGSTLAFSTASTTAIANTVEAFRITFAKDSVPRRVASLGLDLARYGARDFEDAEAALSPLLQLLVGLPSDRDGLRWMHVEGAVLFEASRTVRAPYAMWVERVNIGATISMMADYVGGCVVVVSQDKQGRPIRQAERNIYLPQPNYTAFSGGQVIDVCKLSVLRHRVDSCEIWWRTVRSPNGSAIYDDGTVSFADAGDGQTRVTVRGRQQFTLPPSLAALDLDLQPRLRDDLTQDAYRRFFTTTLDNFEACYEGRDFAIGTDPDPELATVGLSRLLKMAGTSAAEWFVPATETGVQVSAIAVDDRGFTHVAGARR